MQKSSKDAFGTVGAAEKDERAAGAQCFFEEGRAFEAGDAMVFRLGPYIGVSEYGSWEGRSFASSSSIPWAKGPGFFVLPAIFLGFGKLRGRLEFAFGFDVFDDVAGMAVAAGCCGFAAGCTGVGSVTAFTTVGIGLVDAEIATFGLGSSSRSSKSKSKS